MNSDISINLNGTIMTDIMGEDDFDWAAECSEINVTEEEAAWTPTTINYFLDETLKMKRILHNPRHRCKKFFAEVHERLVERGFYFSPNTLATKFTSLKKTFWSIEKNQNNGQQKAITWPYYGKMMEIFAEELEIEDAPTMASLYPDPPLPKNSTTDEALEQLELPLSPASPLSSGDGDQDYLDAIVEVGSETEWCHRTVVAFLQECCNRKFEFSDPKVRRRKIFGEIGHRLRGLGYTFHPDSLDRKLRNLKRHFHKLRDSARRAAVEHNKRTRITWPYYPFIKEIYGAYDNPETEDERVTCVPKVEFKTPKILKLRPVVPKPGQVVANVVPTIIQSPNTITFIPAICNGDDVVVSEAPLKSEVIYDVTPDQTLNEVSFCPAEVGKIEFDNEPNANSYPSTSGSVNGEQPIETVDYKEEVFTPMNASERVQFAQELLLLEERRAVVAEGMLEEFRQLNHIKKKRIEFNRIKLKHILSREKSKESKS